MSCVVLDLLRSYVGRVQEHAAPHAGHWPSLLSHTLPGIASHLCTDQEEAAAVLYMGLGARILEDLGNSHLGIGTEGRIGLRSRGELCCSLRLKDCVGDTLWHDHLLHPVVEGTATRFRGVVDNHHYDPDRTCLKYR